MIVIANQAASSHKASSNCMMLQYTAMTFLRSCFDSPSLGLIPSE